MSISTTPRLPASMPTQQSWPGMTADIVGSAADSTPSKPTRRSRASSGTSMDPSEEWEKLFRAAERRKLQNRNAQRKYRLSLKKRLENLESQGAHITSQAASATSSSSSASSRSTAARSSSLRATSNSSVTTLADFDTCDSDGGLLTSKSLPSQTSSDWSAPDSHQWPMSSMSSSMVLPSIEMDDFLGTSTPSFSPPMMTLPPPRDQMDMVDPAMLNSYFMEPFAQPNLGLAISTEPVDFGSTPNMCQPGDFFSASMTSSHTTPCPSRARTPSGANGLHLAAIKGHDSILKMLIENGADVNESDTAGYTPLHHAVEHGHQEVVKILLESGADFTAKVQ